MKNKICVYTCITGDYDNLNEIENKEKGIDYYCFTNNINIKSNTWNVVYIKDENLDNLTLARKIKILGHPLIDNNYDISVWMDGNTYFKKSIIEFLKKYFYSSNCSFVSFKHNCRNCIYDEINACMKFKKETPKKLKKIKKYYLKKRYPKNNGLIESTVIIRKTNDSLVNKTMQMWFNNLKKYTRRDQLTFNYCIYKTKMPIYYIPLNVWDNEWVGHNGHNKSHERLYFYRLYFGDSINFELERVIDGFYNFKNSPFLINAIIPANTNRIEFEFSEKVNIILKSFEMVSNPETKITYYNCYDEGNGKVYTNKPVILLEGNFLKKKRLKLKLYFEENEK